MTTHKAHPKCRSCNRALHRSVKARVRIRTGLQKFCRNKKCNLFGMEQINIEESEANSTQKVEELKTETEGHELEGSLKIDKEPKGKENKLELVRKDVQKMLNFTDHKVQSFVITLVVIAQEIGEHELSEKLIKRFDLGKYFEN